MPRHGPGPRRPVAPAESHPGFFSQLRQALLHLADVRPRVALQRAEPPADIEHRELVRRELRAELVPVTGAETGAPARARVE